MKKSNFLLLLFFKCLLISCGGSDSSEPDINPPVVVDNTPPVITLIGGETVALFVGETYLDEGATASDETDGDLTTNINIINNVNTISAGSYGVTYNVSDAAGNAANEVIRTVIVSIDPLASLPSRSDDYSKTFEDHFEGNSINTNNWTIGSLKDPDTGDIIPGADGDHLLKTKYSGYVTEEDSYLEDGALVLRNQKRSYKGTSPAGNYDYTSGWAMSMHKVYFNKGYIEMRAQFPSGDKVWPALWLIAEDLVWGPEWDMFEYFGKNTVGDDVMGMHLLVDEWPNQKWDTGYIFNFDATYDCEAWHVYGFEWTAEKAVWTVDGEVKRELLKSNLSPNRANKWPDEDMYIVLNNEVQTNAPDLNTRWPNYLKIDYIEIYKRND